MCPHMRSSNSNLTQLALTLSLKLSPEYLTTCVIIIYVVTSKTHVRFQVSQLTEQLREVSTAAAAYPAYIQHLKLQFAVSSSVSERFSFTFRLFYVRFI